jgi:hypothetical protein
MQHVRVAITAHGWEAAIHPMYGLWTDAEFIERSRALQWNFTGDALGILHYAEGDADAFAAAVADIPEVLDYELEPAGEDAFYVYIRDATTEPLGDLFGPVTSGGLVVVPPIDYRADGAVELSVFGPDAEVQAALERVPDLIDVTVLQVGGLAGTEVAAEAHVTDRQREAVEAALDLGYYEVPRTASHEAVADELDCAPSTAAEHLRKAESAVLRSVFRR